MRTFYQFNDSGSELRPRHVYVSLHRRVEIFKQIRKLILCICHNLYFIVCNCRLLTVRLFGKYNV